MTLSAPVHHHPGLSAALGLDLVIQRDDLLPFPLASSKVRALAAQLASLPRATDVVITNGAIDSNHCRTLAMMGADRGLDVRLVLHGDAGTASAARALRLYRELGASVMTVHPDAIAGAIEAWRLVALRAGATPAVIAGGCHTPVAAQAYRDAALEVFARVDPDAVVVASGTGAIQGGLCAAAAARAGTMAVIGVSVARDHGRGTDAVREAAMWAGAAPGIAIEFDTAHRDGGYGVHAEATERAVALGWRHGLPLDATYTGKAFAALIDLAATRLAGRRVLFWHTGGLWNHLQQLDAAEPAIGALR